MSHRSPACEDGIEELLCLQQGADIDVKIQRMDAPALRRVRQSVMRAPAVRYGAAESDHGLEYRDFLQQRGFRFGARRRRLRLQGADELIALFRQELDAVGGQQLVV